MTATENYTQNPAYGHLLNRRPTSQGDILIRYRSGKVPGSFKPVAHTNSGEMVVAPSDNPHIAVFSPDADVTFLRQDGNPRMTLLVNSVPVEIRHVRALKPHESHVIPEVTDGEGYWEIRRQLKPQPGGGRTLNQD